MNDSNHIVNKIMLETAFINIALDMNDKTKDDEKYLEVINWLENNYFIERIPEGHDKNCEGTMCYCKSRANKGLLK